MHRRRLLLALACGTTGLAGCQTGANDATEPAGSRRATDGTRQTGTTEGNDDERSTADGPLTGVRIETARYRLFADEQSPDERAIDPDDVVPASTLSDAMRDALESARDGGYETREVTKELLGAIDRFRHHGIGYRFEPYVALDGEPFVFDPTVPVFRAELTEAGVERTDPSRTVEHDDVDSFEEPVRRFVRTLGAFSAQAPRDEYRISLLPNAVEEFLDEYEYVEDPTGVGRIETARIDPGPPYSIDVRALTVEDLWGRQVLDGASLAAELRRFLRRAIESDRRAPVHPPSRSEYRTDEVPDAYFARVRSEEETHPGPYVDVDGSKFAFRLEEPPRDRLPVAVSVATAASAEATAFSLAVKPSESGAKPAVDDGVKLEATGALPSVLWITDGDEGRRLLPSDAYDSVSWVPTEEKKTDSGASATVDRRARNVARETVPVDGTLSATYRIPEAVPSGTYRAWGEFGVSWADAESGRRYPRMPYPFQVAVTIDR